MGYFVSLQNVKSSLQIADYNEYEQNASECIEVLPNFN